MYANPAYVFELISVSKAKILRKWGGGAYLAQPEISREGECRAIASRLEIANGTATETVCLNRQFTYTEVDAARSDAQRQTAWSGYGLSPKYFG
ncbi:hypothetical protein IVB11_26575 [Bradyrhizobium sp. 177]|uniref:hypothetical protein n=1 Tax=Bradyrhizobium sp. 177 TaxID=2782647 RepID=UPI001FFA987B|nr:hypothetical protein [Bradyrhizobium sp. 177]MCK1552533.1 hypothetical protein [Bradyrhizobium sp. 177]